MASRRRRFGMGDPDDEFDPDNADFSELNDRVEEPPTTGKWGMGCGLLFIAPFLLGGITGLVTGIAGMLSGKQNAYIGVIVGTVFLAASSAMLLGLFYGLRREREIERKRAEHPDQPWMWREDWAQGFVRSEGKISAVTSAVFALLWNLISWGAVIAFWPKLTKGGDKMLYFIFIFPTIGLGLLAWAIYEFSKHRKFGVSLFRMLSNPGVLGGTLRGAVEIPVQVSPRDGFKVRLQCVHRYTTGSGDNRSTHEDILWEDEKVIKKDLLSHDPRRTGVPVFFNIPYNLPRTSESPNYIWKLLISADLPGVDYAAEFHVLVFKTEASDPEAKPVEDPTSPFQPAAGAYQWPADDPIQVRDSGDFIEAYFPPARNKGVLAFLFFFLLVWNGFLWAMIEKKAPLIFPIAFGFFDLLIFAFFVYSLFESSRIHAGPSGLRLERRFLIPLAPRHFAPEQIEKIRIGSDMQSGDKKYYYIALVPRDGSEVKLANGIPERQQAKWLADRLSDCVGLTQK